MKIPKICRYCGGKVRKGKSSEIYDKSDQTIYFCTNCNAFVLCHERTGLPMGKLANAVLRLKRKETHEIFDHFWRENGWTRTEGYRWLSRVMELPEDEAHIANFEMDECENLIRLCRECAHKGAA